MPTANAYDYTVIRVVPRVERAEFVNAGIILWCHERDTLAARVALDEKRLLALDPDVDLDAVRRHLSGIAVICEGGPGAGEIGRLPRRERFDWLVAPRSTIIQTSAVHTGRCADLDATLAHLIETMVK